MRWESSLRPHGNGHGEETVLKVVGNQLKTLDLTVTVDHETIHLHKYTVSTIGDTFQEAKN